MNRLGTVHRIVWGPAPRARPCAERRTSSDRLTTEQRRRFRRAVAAFVHDLRADGRFRAGLRVKGARRAHGVFELTWDGNGRATWSYGEEIVRGERHIIWHRIGGHDILSGP